MKTDIDIIYDILRHEGYNLSKVQTKLLGKSVNTAYELITDNEHSVLWIAGLLNNYPPQNGLQKIEKLIWLYESLSSLNVPVPSIIHKFTGNNKLLRPYIILSYVPGESLQELIRNSEMDNELQLAYEAGKFLANLHVISRKNIDFLISNVSLLNSKKPLFGDPYGILHLADSWPTYVEEELQDLSAFLIDECFFERKLINEVENYILESRNLWADDNYCMKSNLIHNDYTPLNIRFQSNCGGRCKISGVIDWEWAYIAPQETEFVRLEVYAYPRFISEEKRQNYIRTFLTGYQEINPLSPNHNHLVKVYKILFYLYWAKIEWIANNKNRYLLQKENIKKLLKN